MNSSIKTQIQQVSSWIVNVRLEDIPAEVVHLAKLKLLDCIAAICAGARSTVGVRLKEALKKSEAGGPCTLIPDGEKWSVENAVYFHSAMINALELDNFVFMGHVGQSAFSASLAIGETNHISGNEILLAIIVSVEVAGRFSAYLVSGPHQGHMRAFLHRTASATATAKILGFDEKTTANALAIALSMPEFPLYPACFSPDTKVICTSSPTVAGIKAAFMAQQGMDGPLDIIENPAGFFAYFSYTKIIPDIWRWIGTTWSMSTLSVKNYATCGYAQGPVTAAVALKESNDLNPGDIDKINIYAPMATIIMEKFSLPHYNASITPVNTNFSTIRSVSAALLYGGLNGGFFKAGNFEALSGPILELSSKIRLIHDWQLSIDLLKGIDAGIENAGKPGFLSLGSSKKTFARFRKAFGSRALIGLKDLVELASLKSSDQKYFIKRYLKSIYAGFDNPTSQKDKDNYFSHEGDLKKMAFRLSGRVEVILKNKKKLEDFCSLPPGFADSEERESVIKSKFLRESIPVWGEKESAALMNKILKMENYFLKDVIPFF